MLAKWMLAGSCCLLGAACDQTVEFRDQPAPPGKLVVTLAQGRELRAPLAMVTVSFAADAPTVEVAISAQDDTMSWSAIAQTDPTFLANGKLEVPVTEKPLTLGQGAVQNEIGDDLTFATTGTLELIVDGDTVTGTAQGMDDEELAAAFSGPIAIDCFVTSEALAATGATITAPIPVDGAHPALVLDASFKSSACQPLANGIPVGN